MRTRSAGFAGWRTNPSATPRHTAVVADAVAPTMPPAVTKAPSADRWMTGPTRAYQTSVDPIRVASRATGPAPVRIMTADNHNPGTNQMPVMPAINAIQATGPDGGANGDPSPGWRRYA